MNCQFLTCQNKNIDLRESAARWGDGREELSALDLLAEPNLLQIAETPVPVVLFRG